MCAVHDGENNSKQFKRSVFFFIPKGFTSIVELKMRAKNNEIEIIILASNAKVNKITIT